MKHLLRIRAIVAAVLVACLTQCTPRSQADRPIVILYENDVHCAIEGYSRLAGLRDAIAEADTAYVGVVSVGDYLQGAMAGGMSKGADIVTLINAVGYDAMTLGNHEFDYGQDRLQALLPRFEAPVTSVNYCDTLHHQPFCRPFVLHRYGNRTVAFVGITTPETIEAEGPALQDDAGRPQVSFEPQHLDSLAEAAAREARRAGADYVIALAHMGEVEEGFGTAVQLIAHTTGFDALLMAHSHSVIAQRTLTDRTGRQVPVSQTGTKFAHIGKLTIDRNGKISTELLSTDSLTYRNAATEAVLDSINKKYEALRALPCAHNAKRLSISDSRGNRIVRSQECGLANLATDAMRMTAGTQMAVVNGGGVRVDLPEGQLTYGHIYDVMPFDNKLWVVSLSADELHNMLEEGIKKLPAENGQFCHPSGFRYEVMMSPTPHVGRIEVQDAAGRYVPIEADKRYTLALSDYMVQVLLPNARVISRNGDKYARDVFFDYVKSLGEIPATYAKPQGRIVIKR